MPNNTSKGNAIPDYQQEFSKRSIKNYLAVFFSNIGVGGFSAMFFGQWLTFVFTEYLGVSAALIGLIISISIIVDGVSDFAMGIILDRFITKWGKVKHWFFISAVPLGICMGLMWMIPESTPEVTKGIWAFVMYNLFCTFLTTVRMSSQSLPAIITDSDKVRANVSYLMNIVAALSSTALAWVMTPILDYFGPSLLAYRVIAVICGVITSVSIFLSGIFVTEQRDGKEWKKIRENYRIKNKQEKNESIFQQIKNLLKNKYWLFYIVINFSSGIGVFFGFGVMAYWMNLVLKDMSKLGIMMTVASIPNLLGTMCFMPLSRKLDVRKIAIFTSILTAIFGTIAWIAGASYFNIFLVASAAKCFVSGVQTPVAFVIIPRVIDYGEWKTGSRQEGLCNSGIGVVSKVLQSLATALVGIILAATGYVGGGIATPSAISAINFLFLGVPTLSIIVCAILWISFDLSEEKARAYREEVERRKLLTESVSGVASETVNVEDINNM